MIYWEKIGRRREEMENTTKFKEEIVAIIDEYIRERDLEEEY